VIRLNIFRQQINGNMVKKDIVHEIIEYIGNNQNGEYTNWYVGITDDVDRRVFGSGEHNVSKNGDRWIHCPADSKKDAQEIEELFLALGMYGDTGGGDDDTTIVYCYRKNDHTNP